MRFRSSFREAQVVITCTAPNVRPTSATSVARSLCRSSSSVITTVASVSWAARSACIPRTLREGSSFADQYVVSQAISVLPFVDSF